MEDLQSTSDLARMSHRAESGFQEKKLEKGFLVLSCLFLLGGIALPLAFRGLKSEPIHLSRLVFFALIFLAFPVKIFFDILLIKAMRLAPSIRFFVKHPRGASEWQSDLSVPVLAREILQRLRKEGFSARFANLHDETGQAASAQEQGFIERLHPSSSAAEESRLIMFHKERAPRVLHFLANSFSGGILISPSPRGSQAKCQIALLDTMVLDTGESTRLPALCDYLMCKTEDLVYRELPFIATYQLSVSYLAILASAAYVLAPQITAVWAVSASHMALLTTPVSLVLIAKDRRHRFGFRLVAMSVLLALIPLIGLFFRSAR